MTIVAIGQDKLDSTENLGDFILCERCGERHIIKYGTTIDEKGNKVESKLLGFVECGGNTYLEGVSGKRLPKEGDV